MSAQNVKSLSNKKAFSNNTNGVTRNQIIVHVAFVKNLSLVKVLYRYICGVTLERSHTLVLNVKSHSVKLEILRPIC